VAVVNNCSLLKVTQYHYLFVYTRNYHLLVMYRRDFPLNPYERTSPFGQQRSPYSSQAPGFVQRNSSEFGNQMPRQSFPSYQQHPSPAYSDRSPRFNQWFSTPKSQSDQSSRSDAETSQDGDFISLNDTPFTSSPIEDTPRGRKESWHHRSPKYPFSRGQNTSRGNRGRQHFGNLNRQSNPGYSFNIEDYVSRDMIMDPWAELLSEDRKQKQT